MSISLVVDCSEDVTGMGVLRIEMLISPLQEDPNREISVIRAIKKIQVVLFVFFHVG